MEASGTAVPLAHKPLNPYAGYSAGERPVGSYLTLTSAFLALVAGGTLAARSRGVKAPEDLKTSDVVMLGMATHKLSRMISKDKVTSFIRAPFTEFQEESGQGEVEERARGTGLRRAIGELLVCPYCLAQWVAAGFVGGFTVWPRQTRLVAAVYTAEAAADFLQVAYYAAEERA